MFSTSQKVLKKVRHQKNKINLDFTSAIEFCAEKKKNKHFPAIIVEIESVQNDETHFWKLFGRSGISLNCSVPSVYACMRSNVIRKCSST